MAEPDTRPRRFYKAAGLRPEAGGLVLMLDDRPARTPGRSPLLIPSLPLAEAVAAEWNAQTGIVDPATMPLTRLANSAIDGVAREMEAVRADIIRYAGSDLVAYRAPGPDSLVASQGAAWDPILAWARASLGARFLLCEGVMFVEQPAASLDRVRTHLDADLSAFRIAALHMMTTLSGSALIALMHAAGALSAEAAWQAAHVDELFQEGQWGQDADALARRTAREAEFKTASRFYALSAAV